MKKIEIITKPSKDTAFMNVAVEWSGHTSTVDSYLPHQTTELISSVKAFGEIAKDVIVDNYTDGVKISAPNTRYNASQLYNPDTQGQEIVDALAFRLTKKRQALVAQ